MEARFNMLRGGAPSGGMLATIGTLAEAIGQAPGTNVEALSYRDRTTDLRVLAPSVDALDRIRQLATERGMTAYDSIGKSARNEVRGPHAIQVTSDLTSPRQPCRS